MLKLGTQKISALYLGRERIIRGLAGTDVVFELVPPAAAYTISASLNLPAGGTVTGGGTYQAGAAVTLTYTAAEDYRFTGWYAGDTLLSKENPYTFTATRDMDITARCEEIPTYTLTLVPTGISAQNWSFTITVNGIGPTWSGSGAAASSPAPQPVRVKEGSVTVQAASPVGYEFAGWQIGSGSVVTDNPYTFTVTGDTTLYCQYAAVSRLPAGYTEVEYIEASDTSSCINNIDLRITTGSVLTIDCYMPEISTSTLASRNLFIGEYYYVSGSTYRVIAIFSNGKALKVQTINGAGSTIADTVVYANAPIGRYTFTYDYSAKKASFNDKSATVAQVSGTSYPYFVLGATGPTATNVSKGFRIYSAKVTYTGTNTAAGYKTDLVPCKNSSGTVGLYDITGGKFYGPASTSHPWTAGPAV